MDENREKEMDIEETPQEEIERDERQRAERNETRAEMRTEERAPEKMTPTDNATEELVPLFEGDATKKFRTRWLAIQSKFVDDPRDSVKQADDLVADIIKNVTMNFADRRISLEKQWNSGENVSTEDMRVALKRYRSFFERLLTLES